MGGKGGGGYSQEYMDTAYEVGQSGYRHGATNVLPPEGTDFGQFGSYFDQGYNQGLDVFNRNQALQDMMSQFQAAMPVMPTMSSGPSYEEQMAMAQEANDLSKRDALISSYMDAANLATDYINSEMEQEQANANLLNVDYEITDETKNLRISNYFASIWGAGQDMEARALVEKYGSPKGFEGFLLERGTADVSEGSNSEPAEVTTAIRPGTLLTPEDDENVLGTSALLGASV